MYLEDIFNKYDRVINATMSTHVTLSSSLTPMSVLTEDSIGSSPFIRCNDNNNTTTQDKRSSTSLNCRICHEDSSCEELIDPCECSGTLALIHASCLEKWLSTSNTEHCEICKHPFYIQRKNKSIFKSVWQWWMSRNVHGTRGIAGDTICLVVLTPLCIAATYLCGIGASVYTRLGFWEGTGLAVLCFMLIVTYCLWFVVTARFHYKSWSEWRRRNQDIKLLVKHCTDEERRRARTTLQKSLTRNVQDRNVNSSILLSAGSIRTNRFTSWLLGANLSPSNDPLYVLQQTTFV